MYALEINNLVKKYKNGPLSLKDVNLKVEKGDFFALLGANGAGKTTLINILCGLVIKTEGEAKVFGYDVVKESSKASQMIGLVPQEFNFNIFERVIDIVCTQAGYYGVPRDKAEKKAEEVLKQLDLWEKRNTVSRELSGGMKRRLMIARALMHEPQLLLLDEPTAGVDVELRYGMWDYLIELNKSGVTILLTTHYLEEAEQLCNNVAIIKQGRIVRNDSVKNLLNTMDSQTYVLTVNSISGLDGFSEYKLRPLDETTIEVDIHLGTTVTKLVNDLLERNIQVVDLKQKNNKLEQLFLNLLKETDDE